MRIEELESRALLSAAALVADVNKLTAGSLDAFGLSQSAHVGNSLYFAADDGVHGRELWVSDGTPTGTHLVKDVNPGNAPSPTAEVGPYGLTAVGNTVYFAEDDGTHGTELWKTDGTPAGTVMVRDIAPTVHINPDGTPAPDGSSPAQFTVMGGTLYFTADDGTDGRQLWKTDGTPAGTVMVTNLPALLSAPAGAGPVALTAFGDRLLFDANDADHGPEPWVSDGTAAGTHLLKDVNPGPAASINLMAGPSPQSFTVVGTTAFFAADDGTHGTELWKTDGTADGTALVADVNPGSSPSPFGPPGSPDVPNSSNPTDLTAAGGALFFLADDGTHGQELWTSDGTADGTRLVKDTGPGGSPGPLGGPYEPNGSHIASLTAVGNALFFAADDGTHGQELWTSDGTDAGTRMVKDIDPGTFISPDSPSVIPASSAPALLTAYNGKLYFSADDGVHGREIWTSDGTAAGTQLVKDVNPAGSAPAFTGPSDLGPVGLTAAGPTLFFAEDDGTHGTELWATDGTAAGTRLVKDINTDTRGSYPTALVRAGGVTFFTADDGTDGQQLWKTDGTPAGTARLTTLPGGVTNLTAVGNAVFFTGRDGMAGYDLWTSDGTAAGTRLVATIPVPVVDPPGDAQPIFPGWPGLQNLTAVGGKLFFTVDTPGMGQQLWVSAGTAAGTTLVKQIALDPSGGPPSGGAYHVPITNLTAVGDRLFFTADDEVHGAELWTSDGTAAGTHLVKDINPGTIPAPSGPPGEPAVPIGSAPALLTAFAGKLYFSADDGTHGRELWVSDGTAAGTQIVLDINPSGDGLNPIDSPGPAGMAVSSGRLFFAADDGTHGQELWSSDGTAAGTHLVKDIRTVSSFGLGDSGPGSMPVDLTDVGGKLFFSADDGFHGRELWVSDGTAAGTRLVRDVNTHLQPGLFGDFVPADSNPADLTAFAGKLYFAADDGSHGAELWASDGTAAGTQLVQDINPGPGSSFGTPSAPYPVPAPGSMLAAGTTLYFVADDGAHGPELWSYTPPPVNHPPTASAGGPYAVTDGAGVTLNAGASSDPDGDPLTYSWDVNGDGKFGDAVGAHPTLSAAQLHALGVDPRPSPYAVRVRVADGHGHVTTSAPADLRVRVAPVVVHALNFEVTEGATFNRKVAAVGFNNPEVAPPGVSAYKATIDWGDGSHSAGTVALVNGQLTVSGRHTYAHRGTYAVRVTVTLAGQPAVSDTGKATVDDAPFSAAGAAVRATAGRPFHGVVATVRDANPSGRAGDFTATINWGDGTTTRGVIRARAGGGFDVVGDHTYAHAGRWTVTVRVTSVGGRTVTVKSPAAVDPVVIRAHGWPLAAVKGVPFAGAVVAWFTDADPHATAGLYAATIKWGDGQTSRGTVRADHGRFLVIGAHTYTAVGTFPVKVTVKDRSGNAATATASAKVSPTPPVAPLHRFRAEFGADEGSG
jgi:ELWxxDGT repeat protein